MSSVFVSYARRDWPVAEALVKELQARGFDVWWDRELVAGGAFQSQLAEKLDAARAVIVIWSAHAARSDWVIGEARRALEAGKLLATRLPNVRFNQIPERFRAQQTEDVADLDKIVRALQALGISAGSSADIGRPEPGDRIARSLHALKQLDVPRISYFLPIVILLAAVFMGAAFVMVAQTIGIGLVPWIPEGAGRSLPSKQVGFVPALNWSLASLILFPMAWALISHAFSRLTDIRREVVRSQMVVTTAFEPIREDDEALDRLFRDVRRVTWMLIAAVTTLVMVVSLVDFYNGVVKVYLDSSLSGSINKIGPGASVRLDHDFILRDWSIAAFLARSDGVNVDSAANLWFSTAAYLVYPMLGAGILFSYFLVLTGFGMLLMPGAAGKYGLMLVPDMASSDARRGFEAFSELFAHSVSIMALSFCCAYLMQLQNFYLRVEAPSLWAFLSPDFGSAWSNFAAGRTASGLDDLIGNALADGVPHGALLGVVAWFGAAFMPLILLGIAYLLLRASALRGRRRILREIEHNGMSGLLKLTDLPKEEVQRRLGSMRSWPLSWPRLNQMLFWYGALMTGLIFYKLGFLFMLATLLLVAYVTVNSFHTAELREPD
jgi:hypothetical protein